MAISDAQRETILYLAGQGESWTNIAKIAKVGRRTVARVLQENGAKNNAESVPKSPPRACANNESVPKSVPKMAPMKEKYTILEDRKIAPAIIDPESLMSVAERQLSLEIESYDRSRTAYLSGVASAEKTMLEHQKMAYYYLEMFGKWFRLDTTASNIIERKRELTQEDIDRMTVAELLNYNGGE